MMKDITYCMIVCGNKECHRSRDLLKPGDMVSCSFFTGCKDFILIPTEGEEFVEIKIKESVDE